VDPTAGLDVENGKNLLLQPRIESLFLGLPGCNPVSIPTELPWLTLKY
jgi:hypothetical protein